MAGGEGGDRRWDGWMASLTQWAWVWVNSGSWRWTGKPGMLQPMGSQRVRHDWVTELILQPGIFSKSGCHCLGYKPSIIFQCLFEGKTGVLRIFLFSDIEKNFRLTMYISCPSSRASHFSKESFPFYWKFVLETQDLDARCSYDIGVSLLLGNLSWKNKKICQYTCISTSLCTHTCTHTHTYIAIYIYMQLNMSS